MPSDPELDLRGRLVRGLGALREMLPGSFVERSRKCGKPNCRCADGKKLHAEFLLSVLVDGKPKTFHVPLEQAGEVRSKVEQRKRFEEGGSDRRPQPAAFSPPEREAVGLRRHQFETYLNKVFDWGGLVAALPEGRKDPRHPWSKVCAAVFFGTACQFGPVHRIEAECCQGVLRQRIGPLSEDTMGYALQRQDPGLVFDLGCEIAQRLKRNGVLRSAWARGRMVAAVDGIEICSSYSRCCEAAWRETWSGKSTANCKPPSSTTIACRP